MNWEQSGYSDAIIQKAKERNEHKAFQELVDRSEIAKALVIADRGFESFNSMAQLYASRWGIETSFRDLKYTIGLLSFHSKKVMCILQEIYAHMIMYNFAEMITSHVVIEKKQRKHTYKANFSVATHICRLFYRGKTTPPDLEAVIAKNLIPIRPDRHSSISCINFICFFRQMQICLFVLLLKYKKG